MIDIQTIHRAGVVGFQPNTEAGRQWIASEVRSERWQHIGRTLWLDQCLAPAVIEAAICDGIIIN
jgi:hypothetical protein